MNAIGKSQTQMKVALRTFFINEWKRERLPKWKQKGLCYVKNFLTVASNVKLLKDIFTNKKDD